MSDWSKPTLTSLYTNFLTEVGGRLDDSARQNRSDTVTLTFPPVGLIRWNTAASRWETNTGTISVPVWTALAATYAINAATAAQWATTRTLAATGDVTSAATNIDGSSNVSLATTLATVNSNVGSFGSGGSIPTITVNAKGLVTAVTTNALGGMAGQAASAVAITGGSISGTNLTLMQSTTAAPTAEGRVEWDTDNDLLVVGTSAASKLFAPLDPTTAVTETNRTMGATCTWNGADIAVDYGGTGVSTLSGLAFGNGTSAFTAATAAQVVAAIGATAVANATTSAGCSGNSASATRLLNGRTTWLSGGNIADVAGQLGWKNFGNGHTVIDASAGTNPAGGAINNTNSEIGWGPTYPTLVGWNGTNTYGVRVDSARVADTLSGSLPVTLGGTGSTTPEAARAALGAAAAGTLAASGITGAATSGANTNITSLGNIASINGGQLAGMRNRIINGAMDIAQRGTSFPAVTGQYTLDRYVVGNTSDGVITASQIADGPLNELLHSLRITVTTADTSIAAGQVGRITQRIEGFNARELIGRTFTLSFWVRSSKTGTHCVAFTNAKSYVAEYTISTANTWEKKTVTLNGGTVAADTPERTSGAGLIVEFTYFCGATFQTTANAWQTGQFFGTSNQVNCLDTIGNIFAITGVQLEVGAVATPFEHRPYGAELAMCQRYFQKSYPTNIAPGTASVSSGLFHTVESASCLYPSMSSMLPVVMRASPDAVLYAPSTGEVGKITADAGTSLAQIFGYPAGVYVRPNGIAFSVNVFLSAHYTLSAEL